MARVYNMRVAQAARLCAAHALLFTFTLFLFRKLDHLFSGAWWLVFSPLWLFHVVVAPWRFSIPAPFGLHDFHWAPFHAAVATPLLVAFELLLCAHLEIPYAVNLKTVFLPVVLLQTLIIVDNLRMCFSLKLGETDDSSVNITGKRIIHCLIVISMAFIVAATMITILILSGDMSTINWWHPYSVFSVGQFFGFLVCTKWTYPVIDRYSQTRRRILPSTKAEEVEEDQKNGTKCSLHDIGGHVMKALIVSFEVLLCMHLQGTPATAKEIPFRIIFSPLILLQVAGVVVSTLHMLERYVDLPLPIGAGNGRYFTFSSRAQDFLEFILHGSRLVGWWPVDEPEPRILYDSVLGYTFFDNPPTAVEKMAKRDLVEEVWTLRVALNDLIETEKSSKQKREYLRTTAYECAMKNSREGFCAEFAQRKRLAFCCSLAITGTFADGATLAANCVQRVISPLREQ